MCKKDKDIKGNIPPENIARNLLCDCKSPCSTPMYSNIGPVNSTHDRNLVESISIYSNAKNMFPTNCIIVTIPNGT